MKKISLMILSLIDYEEDFSDDTVSDARWDSWPCKGDYNE